MSKDEEDKNNNETQGSQKSNKKGSKKGMTNLIPM
jgi:hypothetical protein